MLFRASKLPDSIKLSLQWYMLRPGTIAIALVITAVLSSRIWPRSEDTPDDYARYHDRTFRVVNVVDGDTVDIDIPDGKWPHTRIRLLGVDTPEVAGSRDGEMYFGPEASQYAKAMLTGRNVHIVLSPDRTRDKYNRLLAYVYLQRGGHSFNEMLIETGHAYADLRFPHPYRRRFEAVEKHARKIGTGLWANVTLDQMPQWRQKREKQKAQTH